jgi:hypothetical protein
MKRFAIASALAVGLCVSAAAPMARADEPVPTFIQIAKPASGTTMMVVKPEVELGLLTAAGSTEPKDDWSQSAQKYLNAAAATALQNKSYKTSAADLTTYEDPSALQILKLNDAVTATITLNSFVKLPTKTSFDYTLGDGAARLVPPDTDAAAQPAYALFLRVQGNYQSGGRAAMNVGMALLGGPIITGSQRVMGTLVDLKTGQVVWYKLAIVGSGTDIRTPEGATEEIGKLFKDLPL